MEMLPSWNITPAFAIIGVSTIIVKFPVFHLHLKFDDAKVYWEVARFCQLFWLQTKKTIG